MIHRFFQRRTIWWPTAPGWAGLFVLVAAPLLLWGWRGESFLTLTERQPADVLVVEGWIGSTGVTAAKAEFDRGGYRFIVTAGGLTGERFDTRRWNYATEATQKLLRLGVPRDRLIEASSPDTESQRTFVSAVTVLTALQARGIQARSVNVFTRDAHARRSRLIFAKVFRPESAVGVVAWHSPGFDLEPWWKSSERAVTLLKETVGYGYELFLNSGRLSNSPAPAKP